MSDREDKQYRRELSDQQNGNRKSKSSSKRTAATGQAKAKGRRTPQDSLPQRDSETMTFRQCNSGGDADRAIPEPYHSHTNTNTHAQAQANSHSTRHAADDQIPKFYSKYLANLESESKAREAPKRSAFPHYSNFVTAELAAKIEAAAAASKAARSQKSSTKPKPKPKPKTKSASHLRRIVESACKMSEYLDSLLLASDKSDKKKKADSVASQRHKKVSLPDVDVPVVRNAAALVNVDEPANPTADAAIGTGAGSINITENYVICSHCNGTKVMPEPDEKPDLAQSVPQSSKTTEPSPSIGISVHDMVSAKLINPIIKTVQRMYLSHLEKQMAMLDELEALPDKVIEICQKNVFKK